MDVGGGGVGGGGGNSREGLCVFVSVGMKEVSPALQSLFTPESLHVSRCSSVTAAPSREEDDKFQ